MWDVMEAGLLAQGARVAELESRFAELVGVPHAVAVSSGTAALHLTPAGHGHRPRRRGDHGAVHLHRQRQQHPLHRVPGRSSLT